jgi:GTP-binding protein Era
MLTTEDAQYLLVDLPGFQTRHANALNRALNRSAVEGMRDCDVVAFVVEALRYGPEDAAVLERIGSGTPVAHKKENLPELLRVLRGLLPESPAAYPVDQLSDRSERFFAAEVLREKLFRHLGEELPYRCDVVLESFKEEGRLRRIEATIWVERESQKAIVIGARGATLKRIATAARREMEQRFGGKVALGVWVKVRRDWTEDARALRQLGYA